MVVRIQNDDGHISIDQTSSLDIVTFSVEDSDSKSKHNG